MTDYPGRWELNYIIGNIYFNRGVEGKWTTLGLIITLFMAGMEDISTTMVHATTGKPEGFLEDSFTSFSGI